MSGGFGDFFYFNHVLGLLRGLDGMFGDLPNLSLVSGGRPSFEWVGRRIKLPLYSSPTERSRWALGFPRKSAVVPRERYFNTAIHQLNGFEQTLFLLRLETDDVLGIAEND